MVKRLKLATRGFGAEPAMPDVTALAEWIADHRGMYADITTYLLYQSLAPQVSAEITTPCAGGLFYKNRIMECLIGVVDGKTTDEIYLNLRAVTEDAAGMVVQKKNTWCAMPAPHVLGIRDMYYNDEDEWNNAITDTYRTLMRSMRDVGISGHVLICNTIHEPEITSLTMQKVFFFQPQHDSESLASLMEHQHQIAVCRDQLDIVLNLISEYDIRKIIIVDPDHESIARILSCFDPDQISVGGYCTDTCGDYWKNLVESAICTIQ
ncbi:MAG: hypothetical protein LUQ04_09615 [Methanoregula sp.]|nr:hypothetical protein [Methanoregula sp.]